MLTYVMGRVRLVASSVLILKEKLDTGRLPTVRNQVQEGEYIGGR